MKRTLLALIAVLVLGLPGVSHADLDYTIAELLQPCKEGDNDARDGIIPETECEQYIAGFTDLYFRSGLAKSDNVCLPAAGNRDDEVRWAFMRWAHENFSDRGEPAVDGLLQTLKAYFTCK